MNDHLTTRGELLLPSTLASVTRVELMVSHFAHAAGFDDETADHLAMIAREATANAIIHGNRFAGDKQIAARCELSTASLSITLADQGEGLNPDTVPDPLAPENLLRSSGRGIFLMRSFADEVRFRSLAPGTEITLVKHRSAAQHLKSDKQEEAMSLKVKTRSVDGVSILDLSGRVTLGEGSVVLRDAVKEALGKGDKRLLLNLGNVDYIDSSGIGELVSAYTSATNAGGEVKLLNLTKKVHDLLQITKLYTVFDVQDDEAAAISSFSNS